MNVRTRTGLIGALVAGAVLFPAAAARAGGGSVGTSGVQKPSGPVAETAHGAAKAAEAKALAKALLKQSKAAVSPAAVSYTYLWISGQLQQESEWCVPASVHNTLTHWGLYPAQATLAGQLHTSNTSGTAMSAIPSVLNSYQKANSYVDSETTSSAADLYARVQLNVDKYSSPLIPGIQGHALPQWSAYGYYGYHAITLYGYGNNGSYINYYDSLNVTSAISGAHVTSSSAIYSGLKQEYDDLVW